MALQPVVLDHHVLALDEADLVEAFTERSGWRTLASADRPLTSRRCGIRSPCCARAASGHAAAAPPRSVMNSRRLVCRESSIVKGDGGRFMTPPPSRLEARRRLGS